MIVFGLVSTAFDLLTFFTLQHLFRAGEPLFQTAWFVVSLLTELWSCCAPASRSGAAGRGACSW